jgi:hypothetical protein
MKHTLEAYIEGTSSNAIKTIEAHPEHAAMLQRISEAFEHVLNTLASNSEAVVIFVPMAHADFLAAARLALGGELPVSAVAARSCVENSLYAFYLHRNPQLREVWVGRNESDEARKQVRKYFTYAKMITTLTTYAQATGRQVDLAYQRSIDLGGHPNIMKVFVNLIEHKPANPEWLYVNLQEADVTVAIRNVAMGAMAALNTFKLIWPLTFSSTKGADIVNEIREMFIALPVPEYGAA